MSKPPTVSATIKGGAALLDAMKEIASLKSTVEFQATTIRANDHAIIQINKRADENFSLAREWKKKADELESTLATSRKEFAALKKAMFESQQQAASLQGYQHRVREEDDNRRPMVEQHVITQPEQRERDRNMMHPRGTGIYHAGGDTELRRHWTSF
jgi:uncharacterized protein HemX